MWFAGDHRAGAGSGGHGRHDRAGARGDAVRGRKRRIVVGRDEPGTVANRAARRTQFPEVEGTIETDDDRVDRTDRAVHPVPHSFDSPCGNRFRHAGSAAHQHPLATAEQHRRRLSARDDIPDRRYPDAHERRLLLRQSRDRVVGHEQHSATGRTEPPDRIRRARNRFACEPHHAVEIAQHELDRRRVGDLATRLHEACLYQVNRSATLCFVPRFEPFPALRYASDLLDEVTAPPYDVLADADVDALAARHDHNIVRVDVPRERDGDGRYEQAADLLRTWLAEGVLVRDDDPSFTLYRMSFVDAAGSEREIVGVVGALEVVDDGAGHVLPHERVTPKASTDRLDLTRSARANLSPIWGLSLASGLTRLLAEPGEPVGSVSVDGVTHTVERVTSTERVAAISTMVWSDDVLIADGHHRYGVARRYRDEIRAETGDRSTPAELTLAFVSELVADQLSVEAIHRVYRGIDLADLIAALEVGFEMTPAGPVDPTTLGEMQERGALCLAEPNGDGHWLTPRADVFDEIRSLDGLWLEHLLDETTADVTYQHGVDELSTLMTADDSVTAAVLIRPVGVDEIERTAREGLLMPPKSTFFTPKLLTGLVLRPLY